MPVLNKTYTFTNSSGLPFTKTAEVLVGNVVRSSTLTETVNTLTISANIPDNEVTGEITIRVRLIVDNNGESCPKEIIDILPELFIEQWVSFHFRGQSKSLVFESNVRLNNPSFVNVFNSCVGIQYQLASGLGITNWTGIPQLTQAQLISALGTTSLPYSLRITVQDYTQGTDCGICLNYASTFLPANFQYNFQGISQDVVLYFDGSAKYQFVSATSNNGSTFVYNLIINNDVNDFTVGDLTTLAALNSAINAVPANQPYAVQVWVNYSGSNTSAIGTFVVNKI
jgi:hypothetical protein